MDKKMLDKVVGILTDAVEYDGIQESDALKILREAESIIAKIIFLVQLDQYDWNKESFLDSFISDYKEYSDEKSRYVINSLKGV